ncbi:MULTISPECIES: RNA-binding domain-containing protein [unclassified Lebetimonas]|uniref:RNA-binding domain-containing protein n=1 Tax=unclassified Lebetimonas TaxID=2648158 RepID=UPI000464C40F|nr:MULTISPECIES: RNA-binding domain-containing protein [unclassified Lebetimonas]
MKLEKILKQPENRKLEFKESLPSKSDLCKTVVSFANDAVGEIYIGIKDNPREVIGVPEEDLLKIEEIISNVIHDNCYPLILPEISFVNHNGKYVVKIKIYKGNNPPYYLKSKGKEKGTYIRVGSSNRLANNDMIEELEREKQGISFDSLPVYSKTIDELNFSLFSKQFEQITGEKLTKTILKKLNLIISDQNREFPTNAFLLLSNDEIRNVRFPYAKIECARFKGTIPGDFIDQKSINEPISFQAEEAYKFVLRHISQGSTYEGVYRKDRWEYPVIAIREAIRNAVIHRDYSLTGKDIKIAIFDDKIEITSPGKLMPTIDFDDMESGQSDIRNRVLALVFKKLGIIEQWGNGLRLIAKELKKYPEIRFEWSEPGISFRITFRKVNYRPETQKSVSTESATNYDRLRPIADNYERLRTITNDYERLTLEEKKILLYLLDNGKITRKKATEILNVQNTKAYETLTSLVEKNLIQRQGKGRSTYYVLKKDEL